MRRSFNGVRGPTDPRRWRRGHAAATAAAAAAALWGTSAMAQVQLQTITGVPQQIIPQVGEVGLPLFTIPPGTVSILGGSTGTGGAGGGGTGTSTDSSALDTMLSTPWGMSAQQSSEALGVNASALAVTCVLESGCQNVGGAGTITGVFQMTAATYQASLAAALREDPNLATNIVPGLAGQSDPATQAIAAAEYLKQGAQYLQGNGVPTPTALDVRGYYNFGPEGGAAIANAQASDPIAVALSMYTPTQLSQNGIKSGETVGQWRSSVAGKVGSAANAAVLN